MPKQRSNGEGSIVKLANGKYKGTITISIDYNPDNSVKKQNRKTFTHEKRGEVQIWLNSMLAEKNKNNLTTPSEITVGQWLNKWLSDYKKPSLKPNTYEDYKSIIERKLVPKLGKIKLQDLTTGNLQNLYKKLREANLSNRTVQYVHTVIFGALKQAYSENLVSKNVAQSCVVPKPQKKEMRILTEEEIRRLLESNRHHRLYPLLLLELVTGLRRSELLALRWQDIDFTNKVLYVRGNVIETTETGVIRQEQTKTASGIRTISLQQSILDELLIHKGRQLDDIANGTIKDNGIVFPNRSGSYMRPSTLTQAFSKQLAKNAGLDITSFHSLRHTSASLLIAANVHAKVISERLGHSGINITMNTYGHLMSNEQKKASEKITDKINDILNNKKTGN